MTNRSPGNSLVKGNNSGERAGQQPPITHSSGPDCFLQNLNFINTQTLSIFHQ